MTERGNAKNRPGHGEGSAFPVFNMDSAIKLSLVIPAYNEAERLPHTLPAVLDYLARQQYTWEIIVVDDGSQDNTGQLIQTRFPDVIVHIHEKNRGKGEAVRSGILRSQGAFCAYFDADGSTPISELERAWPLFEDGADIVIGSRSLPASRVEIRQNIVRQTMGRIFNFLLRILRLTRFPDTQCGFKVFTRTVAQAVFPCLSIAGFGFDAEFLFLAERMGFRIAQIPVHWRNHPHSKVRMISDAARMFIDALRIRLRALRGHYPACRS